MSLTVKELKKILEALPDDMIVCYEYDGPDTHTEIEAADYVVYSDRIILVEKVLGQS
jgi:hypothetical protein